MKKTLFTSMLALCVAGAAVADDTDYTFTTVTNGTDTNRGGYSYISGFSITSESLNATLTTDTISTTASSIEAEAYFTTGETIGLTSIALFQRDTSGSSGSSNEYGAYDGYYIVITDADSSVVATSNGASSSETTLEIGTSGEYAYLLTFSFTDSTIVIDETYTITFYDTDDDVASIGIAVSGDADQWKAGGTNYGPTAATITTYAIIPEPATASLSLIALAGLMIRRRRQA